MSIRVGTTRSRSGCLVCRTRRIKCDEAKPSCAKCTKAGWACEYESNERIIRSRASPPLIVQAPIRQCLSERDHKAVEFYLRDFVESISFGIGEDYWRSAIVYVSQTEPAVHHALIALGAVSRNAKERHKGTVDRSLAASSSSLNYGLQHYARAISLVQREINPRGRLWVVAFVSLMLICFEFIMGDNPAAMKHTRAILTLLDTKNLKVHDSSSTVAKASNATYLNPVNARQHAEQLVVDTIPLPTRQLVRPIFRRLRVLAYFFDQPKLLLESRDIALPNPDIPAHDQVEQVFSKLEVFMAKAIQFVHDTVDRKNLGQLTKQDFERHAQMVKDVAAWQKSFTTLSLVNLEHRPHLTVEVQSELVKVFIETLLASNEMIFDNYYDQFEILIEQAENFLFKEAPRGRRGHPFSFEMGVLPSVWFMAMKCRHRVLRQRILELLRLTRRREGMWDSRLLYLFALRIQALEERNLEPGRLDVLPNDADRLYVATFDGANFRDKTEFRFGYRPDKPGDMSQVWLEMHSVG